MFISLFLYKYKNIYNNKYNMKIGTIIKTVNGTSMLKDIKKIDDLDQIDLDNIGFTNIDEVKEYYPKCTHIYIFNYKIYNYTQIQINLSALELWVKLNLPEYTGNIKPGYVHRYIREKKNYNGPKLLLEFYTISNPATKYNFDEYIFDVDFKEYIIDKIIHKNKYSKLQNKIIVI